MVKVKKEMFAVVAKILGGSRMDVKCQDGNSRMARIPGSKKSANSWIAADIRVTATTGRGGIE